MGKTCPLLGLLFVAALSATAQQPSDANPERMDCVVVTKDGDAVSGKLVYPYTYSDEVSVEFPGGVWGWVLYADVDRVVLGTSLGVEAVHSIVHIPCHGGVPSNDLYGFQGHYYDRGDWYVSFVEALRAAHREDPTLKKYATDYTRRVNIGKLMGLSAVVSCPAGLGICLYGLYSGPDPNRPELYALRLVGGLGLFFGGMFLGATGHDSVGPPQAIVNYYNEAYPLR